MAKIEKSESTKSLKDRDIVRVKSENYISSYSNNVEMKTSYFDVQMIFGEVLESTHKDMKVEEKIGILMSPQHAKVFLEVFATNLKRYEQQFGTIKMPGQK